jgi:hypothetical protein
MGLPYLSGRIIAEGYNCIVRAGASATDAQTIALVSSFQATEDFQVQEAVVLGNLGPIALDPQGYTCSITMDGFLPSRGVLGAGILRAEDGTTSITDVMAAQTRETFMNGTAVKFEYLDFYNKHANGGAGF